jgi:hypothetical protein
MINTHGVIHLGVWWRRTDIVNILRSLLGKTGGEGQILVSEMWDTDFEQGRPTIIHFKHRAEDTSTDGEFPIYHVSQ